MTTIKVQTNTFEITQLPRSKYKQYDVTWSTADHSEIFSQKKNQLFYHLMNKVDPDFFQPRMIYDGRAIAYSSKDMGPARQWTISLGSTSTVEQNKRGAVTIRITSTASPLVDPKYVRDLIVGGKFSERSSNVTNLLQLIVRQASNMNCTNNGRAYFTEEQAKSLSGPFELWHGIFQSVRPTIGRMVLNVDKAAAVVHKRGRLDHASMGYLNIRNQRDLMLQEGSPAFRKLESHLKGVEIEIPAIDPSGFRRKKIRGLVAAAGEFRFKTDEGSKLTVAEYYRLTYGITIYFSRNVGVRLTGRTHPRPQVVPMEVCNIVPGQLYKKKLSEALVAEMVRFAVAKPFERLQLIQIAVDSIHSSVPLAEAGMKINPQPILVNGVILTAPKLQYSEDQVVTPKNGAWNMMGKKLWSPQPLFCALINFCPTRINPNAVGDITRMIQQCCKDLGMVLAPSGVGPAVRVTNGNPQDVEGTLNRVKNDIVHQRSPDLDENVLLKRLVLVILLPEHGGHIKTLVKYWGDIKNGIATICTRESKLLRNLTQSQYFNNIMLKMNARLGGKNVNVDCEVLNTLFSMGPYMILGADVGHPGAGVQHPSTTSLVYSLDTKAARYAAITDIQNPRVERIEDLYDYVKDAVDVFKSMNGAPVNLVFFRDGLSEGEFDKVARWEVSEIRRACQTVLGGIPKLTYIVVGKRHHITLYPDRKDHGDKNGNCHPGTVVQSGITHAVERDFYLQSHAAIQGTSRSAHYTIIHDEVFGLAHVDKVQQLAYSLCHVYAKATRSVSIPAPVYYADLACSRFNYHISPHAPYNMLFDDGSTMASGVTPFDLSQWKAYFGKIHNRLAQSMYFL